MDDFKASRLLTDEELVERSAPKKVEKPYDGPDRRGQRFEDRLSILVEEAVDERLAQTETNLIHHINVKFGQFDLGVKKLVADHITEAFPEGPLYKHKEFHEGRIKSAEISEKLRFDLMSWAAKGVGALCFTLLGLGALEWFKRQM